MALDWNGKTKWLVKRMDNEAIVEHKKKYKKPNKKRKKIRVKRQNAAIELRDKLIKEATPEELTIKEFLENRGVNFKFQKIIFTASSFYIADFFFPDKKLILEIDGYYHSLILPFHC